ncbi:MAG: hypothetical protein K9J27_05610 [Bacteroidales bacterium]|nr:hypothetical protein [Bacteroidales bacterium]MCF8333396.1 hypothetical protein [Bacteroidales bacterium]
MEENKKNGDKSSDFWFTLDNAAKIFPAVLSKEHTAVFRLTAVLKEPVKITAFLKALSHTEKRFPYFKVQLKEGFFWYYLEHVPQRFPVEVDDKKPCRAFDSNDMLIRIKIVHNRISVEFSHILTDGTGAYEFMKSLLILYSKELGVDIPEEFAYLQPGESIPEEEYEDSYKRYFKGEIPPMVSKSKAFHLPYSLQSKPRFIRKIMIISMPDIKNAAYQKGISINDFLVAVYLFVLQDIYEENYPSRRYRKFRKIRVQVPVNLRKMFPSRSMRNFSLFVMPEIDLRLGHYSFDEILKSVYHQIRLETDKKLINKNISRNVGSEKKIYVKSIPLFLKSLILRVNYYTKGTNQYSGVLTNLGKAKLPNETGRLIDYFIFSPPPPNRIVKENCGIIGFDDKLVVSFGNITKATALEEKFMRFLKNQGIDVKYESEKREEL